MPAVIEQRTYANMLAMLSRILELLIFVFAIIRLPGGVGLVATHLLSYDLAYSKL